MWCSMRFNITIGGVSNGYGQIGSMDDSIGAEF